MNRTKLLASGAFALFVAAMQPAHAQGWYAGLDVGRSRSDAEFTEFLFGNASSERTANSTAVQLRVGYQPWTHFAIEAGFADFGDFDFDFDPPQCGGGAPSCPFTTRTSVRGLMVNVVGTLPLGPSWALNARAGLMQMNVDIRELGSGGTRNSEYHGSLLFGLGAMYRVAEHWNVSLDWRRFEQLDLGLTLGGGVGAFVGGNLQLTSLGVEYRW